jgi:hypothetical protein
MKNVVGIDEHRLFGSGSTWHSLESKDGPDIRYLRPEVLHSWQIFVDKGDNLADSRGSNFVSTHLKQICIQTICIHIDKVIGQAQVWRLGY